MRLNEIVVQGAREHNLKGFDLRIPRGTLTTITGVSGSGKSSLAFDTIFQEGQRRFVESLSAYARQFLGNLDRPHVDRIDGLSPTVSIDQKTVNRNPRSTVGTVTEILDHLRLLFARLGQPHCPRCGKELAALTRDQIADHLMEVGEGRNVQVLAPVVRGRKGEYRKELEQFRMRGFVRARIDGAIVRLDQPIALKRKVKHTIEIVVDRVKLTADKRQRLADAIAVAADLADGACAALVEDEHVEFASQLACPACDVGFPEMEPRLFSFNSPYGACERCEGLGQIREFDPALVVQDPEKSIEDGALGEFKKSGVLPYLRLGRESLSQVARTFGFTLEQPWNTLERAQQDVLLFGTGDRKLRLKFERIDESGRKVKGEDNRPLVGLIPSMRRFYEMSRSAHLERYIRAVTCPACSGARLKAEALAVTFRGRNLHELCGASVGELSELFAAMQLEGNDALIGRELLREIRSRLKFLVDVGLGYLPLDRGANTLSGGEAQRVRLATQVGSQLQGVLYVLDEPSIGLHQRDNQRLIATLESLRDRGNTVLVVEHDRDTMLASDFLVDVGPGAGRLGGEIISAGPPGEVFAHEDSATARFLRGEVAIPAPSKPRAGSGRKLVIRGARQHNLKGIDVEIPLGCLVAVTGVSGSGKSTLVDLVLRRALAKLLHGSKEPVGEHSKIVGADAIDKVVEIDQAPIGRTPRSNPATYSGAFDHVRDLFALLPDARARGYKKGRFSFNVAGSAGGGRCEECEGAGVKIVEMQLLADVEVTCETCGGQRYNRETLEVRYGGKTISDVLRLTVAEALQFFANHPQLARILGMMDKVGLGYLELGQTATTLSGGEAQRLKLATELARPETANTLYILDEPTTGLHGADIVRLVGALQELVDRGNTVVVVEHNLDVVKVADWLIDLGPEGGKGGGELVFAGTPKAARKAKRSWTGRLLDEYLKPVVPREVVARKHDGDFGAPLRVIGAAKNNLQKVDVEIPHGSLTVITGVSGSGKTSLAFDTIFAEAQRRFVESMSTYARRFLLRQDRAPVDRIEGLAPAIAIDRRQPPKNPRSTVATSTELYDYLRVLYARLGQPHCPDCDAPLHASSPSAGAAAAAGRFDGARALVVAPLFRADWKAKLPLESAARCDEALRGELLKRGFLRLDVDGEELRLDAPFAAAAKKSVARAKRIDLVIDRVALRPGVVARLAEALEQAYAQGAGIAVVRALTDTAEPEGGELILTRAAGCPAHDQWIREEPHPRLFSFNARQGACSTCDGLGRAERCDVESLIDQPAHPLAFNPIAEVLGITDLRARDGLAPILRALAEREDFDLSKPWRALSEKARQAVLHGHPELLQVKIVRQNRSARREYEFEVRFDGLVKFLEDKYKNAATEGWWRSTLAPWMHEGVCPACRGERLNPLARGFRIGGMSLPKLLELSIGAAQEFFRAVAPSLEGERATIAHELVGEIANRLKVLSEIGVGYLELGRPAGTLSGGEAQRIRLATQLGNRLVGVLYVLDEPTIGLHPRDTARLLATLEGLRDLGNTVVVVEHDLDVIRAADHLVEIGPGAGRLGGRVVAQGPSRTVLADPASLTGAWIRGDKALPAPRRRSIAKMPKLELTGAALHNLKGIDVAIPARALTCVTGVSGSGKSTLTMEVLRPALHAHFAGEKRRGPWKSLKVPRELTGLVVVDQSPIGFTPSSNAATYTGIFETIRSLFASTPEARARGLTAGHFSFNQQGGRCEACEGRGVIDVEMHFLSDVTVTCEACGGRRYDRATLEIRYDGKSISDVLDLEIDRAAEFFRDERMIQPVLAVLQKVGLGYLRLGQSATTLSGGEAQRIKLAAQLGQASRGSTLYLLDEPTTGLHVDDVARLLGVLDQLVELGHGVLVVEHNLDVIRSADWLIDLGPEGGAAGGRVVATGTPEDVARCAASVTGARLELELDRAAGRPKQREVSG